VIKKPNPTPIVPEEVKKAVDLILFSSLNHNTLIFGILLAINGKEKAHKVYPRIYL
jgi:hypothetical protein